MYLVFKHRVGSLSHLRLSLASLFIPCLSKDVSRDRQHKWSLRHNSLYALLLFANWRNSKFNQLRHSSSAHDQLCSLQQSEGRSSLHAHHTGLVHRPNFVLERHSNLHIHRPLRNHHSHKANSSSKHDHVGTCTNCWRKSLLCQPVSRSGSRSVQY